MGNTNSEPNNTKDNVENDSTIGQPITVNIEKKKEQNLIYLGSQCSTPLDEKREIMNKSPDNQGLIISSENGLYVCTLCNLSKIKVEELLNHCATPQHKSKLKERFSTKKNPGFKIIPNKQVHDKEEEKQNLSHELPNPNDWDLLFNKDKASSKAMNLSRHSNNNCRVTETDLLNGNVRKNKIKPTGLKNSYKSEGLRRKNMQDVKKKEEGQIDSSQAHIQNNLKKRNLIHETPKKITDELLSKFDENLSEISNIMNYYFLVPNKREPGSTLNYPGAPPKEKQTKLLNTPYKKPFGNWEEKGVVKEKYHVSDGNFGDTKKFEDKKAYQKANSTKSFLSSNLNEMENSPSTSNAINKNEQQPIYIPKANRKKKEKQGLLDSNQNEADFIKDFKKLVNFQDLSQTISKLQKSVTLDQTGNNIFSSTDTNFISFTSDNNVKCTLCDINIPKAKNFTFLLSNITAHVEGMKHINQKKNLRQTLEKTIQALN